MPHNKDRSQVLRNGQMNSADIYREMTQARPRDDLHNAFAGDQNPGAKTGRKTHLKNRRLRSSDKTPVR